MIRVRKCLAAIAVYMASGWLCQAQSDSPIKVAEVQLGSLFDRITQTESNIEKERICNTISEVFDTLLLKPVSFHYPFDSLKILGKVDSPDGRLRFYTWNLPYRDGTTRFYGVLQYKPDQDANPLVFRLTDASDETDNPQEAVLDKDHWYGSLVYEITEVESLDTTYYMLMGYSPYNLFISKKVIDIMYFRQEKSSEESLPADLLQKPESELQYEVESSVSGQPHPENQLQPIFGKPVFQMGDSLQCRIIFSYSARAQMTLQWYAPLEMIVFDHLSPVNPSYAGNYQFYGPDFSYDGFVYDNGYWRLEEDIDIKSSSD